MLKFDINKKLLITVCCAIFAAVAVSAAIYFLTLPEEAAPVSVQPAEADEAEQKPPEFYYSAEEAQKIAENTAKNMFGDDAFVVCLGAEPAKTEIHGVERYVYIFGADSLAAQKESGKIRGLYHIDADSGEIFDNGNGNMEKIMIGE